MASTNGITSPLNEIIRSMPNQHWFQIGSQYDDLRKSTPLKVGDKIRIFHEGFDYLEFKVINISKASIRLEDSEGFQYPVKMKGFIKLAINFRCEVHPVDTSELKPFKSYNIIIRSWLSQKPLSKW